MRKNKFLVVLFVLMLAVCSVALSACNKDEGGGKPPETAPQPAQSEINEKSIDAVMKAATGMLIQGINATVSTTVTTEDTTVSLTDVTLLARIGSITDAIAADIAFDGKVSVQGSTAVPFSLIMKGDTLYLNVASGKLQVKNADLLTLLAAVASIASSGDVSPVALAAAAPAETEDPNLYDFIGDCTYTEADGVATIKLPILLNVIDSTLTGELELHIKLNVTTVGESSSYTFKSIAIDQTMQDIAVQAQIDFLSQPAIVSAPADAADYADVTAMVQAVNNALNATYYEFTGSVTTTMFFPQTTNLLIKVNRTQTATQVYVESTKSSTTNKIFFDGNDFYFALNVKSDGSATSLEKVSKEDVLTNWCDYILDYILQNPLATMLKSIMSQGGDPSQLLGLMGIKEIPALPEITPELLGQMLSLEWTKNNAEVVTGMDLHIDFEPLLGEMMETISAGMYPNSDMYVKMGDGLIRFEVDGTEENYFLKTLSVSGISMDVYQKATDGSEDTLSGTLMGIGFTVTMDASAELPEGGINTLPQGEYADSTAQTDEAVAPLNEKIAALGDLNALPAAQFAALQNVYEEFWAIDTSSAAGYLTALKVNDAARTLFTEARQASTAVNTQIDALGTIADLTDENLAEIEAVIAAYTALDETAPVGFLAKSEIDEAIDEVLAKYDELTTATVQAAA